MKSVLISIQPKWVEKIANGKKTIEVRKTRPKIETPFKCYIYCTKGKYDLFWLDEEIKDTDGLPKGLRAYNSRLGNGSVVGEFTCDKIDEFHEWELTHSKKFFELEQNRLNNFLKKSCLTYEEICNYRKNLPYYKPLYGWHITDLKIYDKPRELSEFKQEIVKGAMPKKLIRPPQSWFYIEVGE